MDTKEQPLGCWILQMGPKGFMQISGRRLLDAAAWGAMVEKFLDLFAAAYGLEWLTPKVHWLLHLGDHYTKHQILPNCFGLEGKHRLAKRYAEDLKFISRASSESLVMEVTCHHLAMLGNPSSCIFDVGLLPKRQASKKVLIRIRVFLRQQKEIP